MMGLSERRLRVRATMAFNMAKHTPSLKGEERAKLEDEIHAQGEYLKLIGYPIDPKRTRGNVV